MTVLTNLSIRARLVVSVLIAMAAGLAVTIVVLTARISEVVEAQALREAQALAENQASEIEGQLASALQVARSLAQILRGMKKAGIADRVAVSAVLREMLESNPNLLGTYTGWEPNAFDGRDSASANTEGHDASGRFVPYWNRASGKVEVEALLDYDKDGLGDYYMLPKKLKHEVIIEPYIYPVGGRKVLMTSLVVPIIIDGTFQGIAGVDIDLADINARAAKEHPFGTGNVQLVSNGGLWVAYPKVEVLGKPIESTNAENAIFKERIKAGQGFNHRGRSVSLGITIERSVVPINIGETGTPWAAMVAMPLNEIQAPVHTIRNLLILSGALLAVALSGVMVVLANRVVGRPLTRMADELHAIAESRDLTRTIAYGRRDEIGLIADSLNSLLAAMCQSLAGIAGTTRQVAAASGEASTAIGQISDGARTQFDSYRQISSAMDQTAKAVTDVAHNAGAASDSARKAASLVDNGKARIADVVSVVRAIAEDSKKINQIADIIARIAAQTNMLSLNAAIEAARAGEHGKGFAVVAEEVRKLADSTSASASEIGALMVQAAREAERGVELVDAVNVAMEDIVCQVRDSDDMVQRIAAAITEQSATIEQITGNVSSLSRVGAANAAAAEEITSTMVELARLADQTRVEVARFRVG